MLARGVAIVLTAGSTSGRAAEPASFAASDEVKAAIRATEAAMKPGQIFAARPIVRDGTSAAAIEIWKAPGKPAVHPTEAEYVLVVAGSGSLVSGGDLVDAVVKRPGLTEGSRIEGGTTRSLAVGDVMLIPAGTPHWFGVNGGELVLLGTKLPRP